MSTASAAAANPGPSAPAAPSLPNLDATLARGLELLPSQPSEALEIAQQVLQSAPSHSIAQLLLGMAERLLARPEQAAATLAALVAAEPKAAVAHYEYALALSASGRGEAAIEALRRAVALNPSLPGAWRALGDHLTAIGDAAGADAAYARHVQSATRNPQLMRAAAALYRNEIPAAEALLREHLRQHPTDVAALRMLGEVAARLGRYADAETLLARCLELAPGFSEARAHYATVLNRCNRPLAAQEHVDRLLAAEPANPNYRNLKAAVLVSIGEYQPAAELYGRLLAEYPRQAKIWLSYGHVLKTLGRPEESVRAYRKALELSPSLGEAWWSLANLKTYRFTTGDIAAMGRELARADGQDEDRLHLHFALGKAHEDAQRYEPSFEHYAQANRLRRAQTRYDAEDTRRFVERSRALYTRQFLDERADAGCPAPDPIFIVGLPRAGSTLIDQILSSHSQVEGTMELPDITSLARQLDRSGEGQPSRYPQVLATLPPARLRELGEAYMAGTRVQRKTAAPCFIDKMPNNFLHLGLILLALPNARIIDARRHPLGCCLSAFKQHFARGQYFSYSLEDLGRYYRDYVELMAHFDLVAPGRVHRVHYEALVEDTEAEVRSLLDYCGLPFEDTCLRFYETPRAVRTASSEQVRRPIFRDGLQQWRHYERWLEPLKSALGEVLESYPALPPARAASMTGSRSDA